jgi:hypothetical protein
MRTLSLGSIPSGAGQVLVWAGRLIAVPLFLLWGAFLVEHLSQWFLASRSGFPPPWVWIAQLFHLAIVIGLAGMFKWEKVGSVVTLAGTAGFVITVGDWDILRLASTNLIPVLCFATARVVPLSGRRFGS